MAASFFPEQQPVISAEDLENASIRILKDVDRMMKINANGSKDEAGKQYNQILSASADALVEQTYRNAATPTQGLKL